MLFSQPEKQMSILMLENELRTKVDNLKLVMLLSQCHNITIQDLVT